KMCITPQVISNFTFLICEGDSIDDDLEDKEVIKKTLDAYNYKKGLHYFEIEKIPDPVMRMAVHLVTKLNDQERWIQVNKAWLN
ncbi:hypothetical protein KI387_033457, partial [Taxus chinensis]